MSQLFDIIDYMLEGVNHNRELEKVTNLNIPPLDYYDFVTDFNRLLQHELSEILSQNVESFGEFLMFVTPGSDGRLEKGSFFTSPLEVIAITDDDLDLDLYREKLTEVINRITPTRIARIIEMKGPQSSLVTTRGGKYEPGRIADSRLIYGSQESAKELKLRLGKEILNLHGSPMRHIADLKRNARKATERGTNKIAGVDAIHFDLKSGIVFFNPSAYQLSFKIGPLRLVQNTLLVEEIKHTRQESDPNFISTLDSSIVGRLNQLKEDGRINLNRSSVEEVAEHYAFFLRLYHRSEQAYEKSKQVAIQLTPSEVEEVASRLQALQMLMENFKIQK